MKVSVNRDSKAKLTLEVEIPAERVEETLSHVFNTAVRNLQIPGFRKGKVPPKLAQRFLPKEMLSKEVLEHLVPDTYMEALRRENIVPLNQPKLDIVKFEPGEPLIYKAEVEVKPEVDLAGYTGLEADITKVEITDEAVQTILNRMREEHVRIVTLEDNRPLRNNDMAVVNFKSWHNDELVKGGSAENFIIELEPSKYVPGFIDPLIGMQKGETKTFMLKFPKDYPTEMAEKEVKFEIQVLELKAREYPEINDDFAKEVSMFGSLKEWQDYLMQHLRDNQTRNERNQIQEQILDKLIPQVDFELPHTLVDFEIQYILSDLNKQLKGMKLTLDDYLKNKNISLEDYKLELKPRAERLAKVEIILDAIARQEKLSVTSAEIDAEIEKFAKETQQDANQIKEVMRQEGTLPTLSYSLLKAKSLNFLIDNAKVTYQEPKLQEEAAAEPAVKEPKKTPRKKKTPETATAQES